MRRYIILALAAFVVAPAQAQEADYASQGVGTVTCAKFAEMYRDEPDQMETIFFSWAQGFLSGWNLSELVDGRAHINLARLNTDDQMAFLRRFCDQNPLKNYMDATIALRRNLMDLP